MQKIEILKRWYREVWSEGNLDAIDRYFSDDTVASGLIPEMQMGREEFRELVSATLSLVEKVDVTLLKCVEEGDWLSAIVAVNALRVDTQAPVQCSGQIMVRFDGDKMVETYNHFDFMVFFEHLGQMPTDTMAICMTGQRLVWA